MTAYRKPYTTVRVANSLPGSSDGCMQWPSSLLKPQPKGFFEKQESSLYLSKSVTAQQVKAVLNF